MPIRQPKQIFSDRGSLKDLVNSNQLDDQEPPTQLELRMKELYEYATLHKNEALKESLGFIVMNQPGAKDAFPVTLFRHREYINSLQSKYKQRIDIISSELSKCIAVPDAPKKMKKSLAAILPSKELIKIAGIDVRTSIDHDRASFKRVR